MKKIARVLKKISLKKLLSVLRENKRLILTVLMIVITIDIFLIKESYDIRTFSILIIYGILVKIFNLKSKLTFTFCLIILAFMFISFLTSSTSVATEKAAVWLVLFMMFGVAQQWIEIGR